MKIRETSVTGGGVFRCCHAYFENIDPNVEVQIGEKRSCIHCKENFTLMKIVDGNPVWFPDWQIDQLPKA